ncbi:MAG: cobaltochelatase subunit CobN [Nitrospirae bacterium]|nr:cobaltochelatase subunit CobN [Nitrospirota bacterium]
MCLNKRSLLQGEIIMNLRKWICINFIGWIVLFVFWIAGPNAFAAELTRVSLLLGDVSTKQALDVVQELSLSQSALAGVSMKVYSSTGLRGQDMEFLKRSELVIIIVRGRAIIDELKPELLEAIKRGGKVYAVGPGYNDEVKALGILTDEEMRRYFETGGQENLRNGILYALSKQGFDLTYQPVKVVPDVAIYEATTKKTYTDFNKYLAGYPHYVEGRPWVSVLFYQSNAQANSSRHIDALIAALERRGFNVLPAYGYPPELPVEKFLFDADGKPRVEAVIAISMKFGVTPDKTLPLHERLGVPIIDAISLTSKSLAEWEVSPTGLDIMERSWQVGRAEMGGLIQPTVFATKEKIADPKTGMTYFEERPIPERVEMLARRVEKWINLRHKPNPEKRVLLHYFNSPSGKERIGASNLNVVPRSLWQVMSRLMDDGYSVTGMPQNETELQDAVVNYGSNIPSWNIKEIYTLARSGRAVLLPMETYKRWFSELPSVSQKEIVASWGQPEKNDMMAYTDTAGKQYFVLPMVQYGNILLSPQPAMGWSDHVDKVLHDVTLPPSHQYLAFYFWLRKEFRADAIVQFGTHGTHEWLPGKEVGLAYSDSPEYLFEDIPNLYYFIVDDPGEGIQAKRRGMGVMIDHMTPPTDKATLNPQLRELKARLNDYSAAVEKSPALAEARLKDINELAEKMGILKDLGIARLRPESSEHEHEHEHGDDEEGDESIHELEHYLDELAEKQAPHGLHTLGVVPEDKLVHTTAEAIASANASLTPEQRATMTTELEGKIRQSARNEMNSLILGLSGRFVPAGMGGEPLRNPNVLPTGRNFYSFDPTRIPGASTYAIGARLARELIDTYKKKHGVFPDKLTYQLWGVETMRHEGITEAQIMYLMGVRPVWDNHGTVRGVEAISRSELGRPRIDVTIITSGEYRDLFANLVPLMDQTATVAREQDEQDNIVRINSEKTEAMLQAQGVAPDVAARLAGVRIFSMPPGAYGTNIAAIAEHSHSWDKESQVADVYFMRMSYMYGQGFWGDAGEKGVGQEMLKTALSGTKVAVHSRSSSLHQSLDGDDFFQYLGGAVLAIRTVDGTSPEVYVSNLADPGQERQETLEKMMGREMRTRYLNPVYIKGMMKEGYAGAKHINLSVQNLWGWQVTVPEAVDEAKWNEMYETYVLDRNGLSIKEFFRQSRNMWAYQAVVARMLETTRKGYWKPDREVIETLSREFASSVDEVGLACDMCNNSQLVKLASSVLANIPGLAPQARLLSKSLQAVRDPGQQPLQTNAFASPGRLSAPSERGKTILKGYEIEDVIPGGAAAPKPVPYLFLTGFLILITLVVIGWRRRVS